jgi:hypothetical protein
MHTPPEMILFMISVGLIILAGVCMLILKYVNWREHMSSRGVRSVALESNYDRRFSAVSRGETNYETAETYQPVEETESQKIHFAETEVARALARLILAEKVGLTDAVKVGCGKKSGEAYQRASAQVKAAIEEQKQAVTPIAERSTPAQFPSEQLR